MVQNRWLTKIAESIADGIAVDWAEIDGRSLQAGEAEIIRRLKSIEEIVRAHTTPDFEANSPPTWGHLRIRERIGGGTHGDVYRAYDARLDREVALKLLKPGRHYSDSSVVAEARLMAKIRHPGVVVVHGADTIHGRTGICMELIRGEDLASRVRRSGPLETDDLIDAGLALCSAVGAIHKAGLLHRDIKAQNVIREATGRLLLTDFGTSEEKFIQAVDRSQLVGTPAYLAPEVLAGARHSTISDIYALGTLLYFLAVGSLPNKGDSIEGILAAHRESDARRTARLAPELPPEVALVIDAALEKDPAARISTTEQLASALEQSRTRRSSRLRSIFYGLLDSPTSRVQIADHFNKHGALKASAWSAAIVIRDGWSDINAWRPAMVVRAYLVLALVPSWLLVSSDVLSGRFASVVPTFATIVGTLTLWATFDWRHFLPLSFLYATALPRRYGLSPASLVVSGLALTVFFRGFVDMAGLTFKAQALAYGLHQTSYPISVALSDAVKSMVDYSIRFGDLWLSHTRAWQIWFSLGQAVLTAAMVLLGTQIFAATNRFRLLALWAAPIVYVALFAAVNAALGEFEGFSKFADESHPSLSALATIVSTQLGKFGLPLQLLGGTALAALIMAIASTLASGSAKTKGRQTAEPPSR